MSFFFSFLVIVVSFTTCGMYSTSLGYAMTWIMSQRILLHPRGAYPPPLSSSLLDNLVEPVDAETERTSVVVQLPTVSPLSSGVETTYNVRSDASGSVTVDRKTNPTSSHANL